MHERLVYGLFTPFSAVLIPASCVSVKAFLFPWYSQIRQAAGARRAVRSRPGSAQSPRPPQSTALTVSIKAQQPVAKLARPAECTVRSQGPGGSRCAACGPRGERTGRQVAAGGAGWGRGPQPPFTTSGLGEGQHFVLVPLLQLRATPRSSWGTFHNLENVESSHSYFCLFFY